MNSIKIVIEHHKDGYVGYPLGFERGAIVGQGDTYAAALKDTEKVLFNSLLNTMGRKNSLNTWKSVKLL